jgi:hypothetical protein
MAVGKGVLDQAQKLGLNLADVVASAMGNKGAAGRISASLGNLMAQTESSLRTSSGSTASAPPGR